MRYLGGVISFCLVGLILISNWGASAAQSISSTTLGNTPWPMFRHDLLHTGRSPYLGAQTFHVKWAFDTGEIESTPAIDANGSIYVQSLSGYLYSLCPNGTLRWRYPTFDFWVGCCISIESSPAIDSNGLVYAGSSDGNLYALFSNGTLEWKFATGGPIQSSPAIGNDGTIYVGSYDGNLYAIARNGQLKWKFATAGIVVSSPAIDSRGVIYVGSNDARLYAIYPSGGLKWIFKTGGGISSSPAIGSGGMLYVESRDGNLYAVNSAGQLAWKFLISPYCELFNCNRAPFADASPAIGPRGIIYIGCCSLQSGGFYAISRNGTLLWRFPLAEVRSSAAVGADGTIYVGVDDPIYAFNPDGTVKWSGSRREIGDINYSSPSIAPDGTIYIGALGGILAISSTS